jgi:transposase InsO family protein
MRKGQVLDEWLPRPGGAGIVPVPPCGAWELDAMFTNYLMPQQKLRPRGEMVHYSDAGSQHTSIRFGELLEGLLALIGSVGNAYDNALAESTIGLFKNESIRNGSPFLNGPLRQLADVDKAARNWVHWYNTARLHST